MTTAYAFVWISSATAISVGVYITKSAEPLWALFIPGLVSFHTEDKDEKEKTGEKEE